MILKKIKNAYSLSRCKKIFRYVHRYYLRKRKNLGPDAKEVLKTQLQELHTAIKNKQPHEADQFAHQVQQSAQKWMTRTVWDRTRDFVGAIVFALCLAVVIRQMWFEFYSIPTGSMRPTLKEGDFLVVTKEDYGLNVPLKTAHFYFDPSLVQRGSIVVFTGEHMDIADADTVYFYLFPGKKQFVKRLIGKPGDILYFYGGQIYGINSRGEELDMLRNTEWFQSLEHIPYIYLDGKVDPTNPMQGIYTSVLFSQMNIPIAKLTVGSAGLVSGEMLPQKNRPLIKNYSDLWGFKNFAMARLLSRRQLEQMAPNEAKQWDPAPLYLSLDHHATLQGAKLIRDEYLRYRPDLSHSTSILPLTDKHIAEIANHMTTCRFLVKGGIAHRYGSDPTQNSAYLPKLPNVPDGTYEMQNGTAYEILLTGISKELKKEHPIYPKTAEQVQLLYNLGIQFSTQYSPSVATQRLHPSRYAYFRNHDLYLMGAPIIQKGDPSLTHFYQREYQKQSIATAVNPYTPFDDNGPPLTPSGDIDAAFIRQYGIQVPEKMYLVLGDNHAMSADSRDFGFVPEDNLKGSVKFLFWPPGARWGTPPEPLAPFWVLPKEIVWGSAVLISIGCWIYLRRRFTTFLEL